MALIRCQFESDVLGMTSSLLVALPDSAKYRRSRRKYACLFLLHGLGDDESIWQRRTSIERYLDELDLRLAVVMPCGHRSFYSDMKSGLKYWTYLSREVPAVARHFLPISEKREDAFAAGNSMGGYGAFKLALRCPDRFAAAASLSGALDMAHRVEDPKNSIADFSLIYGDPVRVRNTDDDLLALLAKRRWSTPAAPQFYQCCGVSDFLYQDNLRFRDAAKKCGLKLTYEEGPGDHDWGYWDQQIKRVLKWLPLKK